MLLFIKSDHLFHELHNDESISAALVISVDSEMERIKFLASSRIVTIPLYRLHLLLGITSAHLQDKGVWAPAEQG